MNLKFRTEIFFPPNSRLIQKEDCITYTGSCFATTMADKFRSGQIRSFGNPFGILYNPAAIRWSYERLAKSQFYTEEDLIHFQGQYLSLDHHSSFNGSTPQEALEKINRSFQKALGFFHQTDFHILTLGTAWVYEYKKEQRIVANCHKIPQKEFNKRLLSPPEIAEELQRTIELLRQMSKPDVQLLLTVSPIRHLKDGFVENQRSKAHLISAVHEICEKNGDCTYLPVYETLMDDLRDYRFYQDDLLHPSDLAVEYIWDKFAAAFISEETRKFMEENFKIQKALNHRPFAPDSSEYLNFKENLKARIEAQQKKVSFPIFEEAKNFGF